MGVRCAACYPRGQHGCLEPADALPCAWSLPGCKWLQKVVRPDVRTAWGTREIVPAACHAQGGKTTGHKQMGSTRQQQGLVGGEGAERSGVETEIKK